MSAFNCANLIGRASNGFERGEKGDWSMYIQVGDREGVSVFMRGDDLECIIHHKWGTIETGSLNST